MRHQYVMHMTHLAPCAIFICISVALLLIIFLREKFKVEVGLSDHTGSIFPSIAALRPPVVPFLIPTGQDKPEASSL